MNRTKIICTIGPASRQPETLERLVEAGMNVCRLNFSHGTHAEHAALIKDIRAVSRKLGVHLAILQDLAGPKIRTGKMAAGTVTLVEGATFTLTNRDVPGDEKEVGLTYSDLPHNVRSGDTILLADGAMSLQVKTASDTDVVCEVVDGGELSSNKGINLPNRSINAPIMSDKDKADLKFGLEQGVRFRGLVVRAHGARCAGGQEDHHQGGQEHAADRQDREVRGPGQYRRHPGRGRRDHGGARATWGWKFLSSRCHAPRRC